MSTSRTLGVPTPKSEPASLEAFRTTGSSPGLGPNTMVRSTAPPRRQLAHCQTGGLLFRLPFEHGPSQPTRIRWEIHGAPDLDPVVVLGGISASRHLLPTDADPSPGWWPGVVAPDGALDPRAQRLIGLDFVKTAGRPTDPITTHDQATAVLAALDHLGIQSASIVGASYGGMVGLALAIRAPQRVKRLVLACAAHRPHPMATALRALQRDVVRAAQPLGLESSALKYARALAMTTYRSASEFDARFDFRPERRGHESADTRAGAYFPVQSYLEARGESFVRRFDAEVFLSLSESIDLHDVAPEELTVPTTLISVDTDAVVPPFLAAELARRAAVPVRHVRVSSPCGHDAFLTEPAQFGPAISAALEGPR